MDGKWSRPRFSYQLEIRHISRLTIHINMEYLNWRFQKDRKADDSLKIKKKTMKTRKPIKEQH